MNRTREYFADHYASEVTRDPDSLSSALVKIAHGLVKADGEYRESLERGDKKQKAVRARQHRLDGAVAVMGICNVRSGAALVLGSSSPEEAAAVMRWDLVNPWARLYELSSTHPLTALRVRALNKDAKAMRQTVQYPLPQDRAVQWGWFPMELVIWSAPFLCAALLVANEFFSGTLKSIHLVMPERSEPALLVVFGITWIVRIAYRYRGAFEDRAIGSLLRDMDVSQMGPRAVRLRGEIIGRGVPGAFWSADLVIRDATGMLFVLYRQSVPFARLFFAFGKADQYIGQHVELQGWFRRGLTPYIEMDKLTDGAMTNRAYSRWVQYSLAAIPTVVGAIWMR